MVHNALLKRALATSTDSRAANFSEALRALEESTASDETKDAESCESFMPTEQGDFGLRPADQALPVMQSPLSSSQFDRRQKELSSAFFTYRDTITRFHEARPLGSNPVGDKAGVSPGFFS